MQETLSAEEHRSPGRDTGFMQSANRASMWEETVWICRARRRKADLAVGDVAGKGLPARALHGWRPLRVASAHRRPVFVAGHHGRKLDHYVRTSFQPDHFLTLFLGQFDCLNGTLTYCNAGHIAARPVLEGRSGLGARDARSGVEHRSLEGVRLVSPSHGAGGPAVGLYGRVDRRRERPGRAWGTDRLIVQRAPRIRAKIWRHRTRPAGVAESFRRPWAAAR